MTTPRKSGCSACTDPRVREIEDMILQPNRSLAGVARFFKLDRQIIQRHRAHHMSPDAAASTPSSSPAPQSARASVDSTDPAAVLQAQLTDLSSRDTSKYTPSQLDRHDEQVRRVAESLSRVRPPTDQEGPAQRALRVTEAMLDAVLDVVERHPEMRPEFADAMRLAKAKAKGAGE